MYKAVLIFALCLIFIPLTADNHPSWIASPAAQDNGFPSLNNPFPKDGHTLQVNSYDKGWYESQGYAQPDSVPPFNDPHDLNAEILFNGQSFNPPVYTPYTFGGENGGKQPNYPFLAGMYALAPNVDACDYWYPLYTYFMDTSFDQSIDFMGVWIDEPTPVELSSFSATVAAAQWVNLTWISQSETNLLGYRVYRNDSSSQATAQSITPVLLQATNTSAEHSYSLTDSEVGLGQTYYYWLESVEPSSSEYFGPVSVTLPNGDSPDIPTTSWLENVYPNPFRASSPARIGVVLKLGETGTVTIYNLSGQAVKSYAVPEGGHIISWNGTDNQGNLCGSGIYYYTLRTPSLRQTKRMIFLN